jgi:hypothetical protein
MQSPVLGNGETKGTAAGRRRCQMKVSAEIYFTTIEKEKSIGWVNSNKRLSF